jgi:hypothetical protein
MLFFSFVLWVIAVTYVDLNLPRAEHVEEAKQARLLLKSMAQARKIRQCNKIR